MIERSRRVPFFLAVLCLLLIPTLASAQATIKVNDNINFKFGTLIQTWAMGRACQSHQGHSRTLAKATALPPASSTRYRQRHLRWANG